MTSHRMKEWSLVASRNVSNPPANLNSALQPKQYSLSRRGFCNGLLLTSAALVVAETASASKATWRGKAFPDPPMRIEGAEALMPGTSLLFSYPRLTDSAILVRARDGAYHAYCQKCSHLGCSIFFDGAYDVKSGFVVAGPPKRPLDEIMLQVRGGQVWAVGRRSDYEPVIAD